MIETLSNPIVQMTFALAVILGGFGGVVLFIANRSLAREERRMREQ